MYAHLIPSALGSEVLSPMPVVAVQIASVSSVGSGQVHLSITGVEHN